MRRWVFGVALVLWSLVSVDAQHTIHVDCGLPDRCIIGTEFVPRFIELPVKVIVAAGQSATLAAGTYDYIEVGGTLTIPDIDVSVTHLLVLPGGTLIVECGATITGRDVTINTARDPFQWGNGLVNFGTRRMICPPVTPFVAISPASAGASSVTLLTMPIGWQAGDEVVLPDTRQITTANQPRRDPVTTITEISGNTLSVSPPLGFARDAVRRPDGSLVLMPRIANVSRQTVVKSENPNGTRWHVANIGAGASWDVQGVEHRELGRTRPEPIHNTVDNVIGTNQVGKYADHNHHNGSVTTLIRRTVFSSYVSTRTAKWASADHQTHDTERVSNTCVGFNACFVTEDGNEARNVYRGNFAAYGPGTGVGSTHARSNVEKGNPGAESCYWFRGVKNIIEGNEAWNCQTGFDLFNILQPVGGQENTVPISLADNIGGSNTDACFVYWQLIRFPNERLTCVNNAVRGVWISQPNGPSVSWLVDPILINQGGVGNGTASANGYNQGYELLRGEIRGFANAGVGGLGQQYGRITETQFQNVADFYFEGGGWPQEFTFTGVRSAPLGSNAHRFFHTIPIPLTRPEGWFYFRGTNAPRLNDWNGTTNDYDLVPTSTARTAAPPRSANPIDWQFPAIECGATLGEVWDRCGYGYAGAPYGSEAISLPGIINMLAVPPRPAHTGTPRAILTAPRSDFSAVKRPDYGAIVLMFALTGNAAGADTRAYFRVSFNGGAFGPRHVAGAVFPNWAWFHSTDYTPGTRDVRTWRELNGVEVAGSSMTFRYFIGSSTPGPLPVDCVLSPVTTTVGPWVLSGTTYTQATTASRTILTPPSNGGAACQP